MRAAGTLLTGLLALGLAACAPAGATADPPPGSTASDRGSKLTPSAPPPTSAASAAPTGNPAGERLSRTQATRLLQRGAADGDATAVRRALDARADLEVRDEQGRTPLVAATKSGHTEVAVQLLEAGADPNAKDDLQDSAFLYAGAEGLNEILRATVRHGADPRSTNRYGGTALIPASEHAHVDTVRILIDAGVPLDHVNKLGWTALLEAVVLGDGSSRHVDVVRQLVGAGADPQLPDGEGRTPRQLAVSRGQDRVVAVLDDADGVRDRARRLIAAARSGEDSQVQRLLEQNASVSARDDSGATALVAAAYGNHLGIARRLLEAGADPNVKDDSVQSAYLIATSEVGDDPRLLELTLDHGGDVASLDSWRGTGLIRAADRGHAAVVARLLRTPIAIDHVNRIGYTALHEAVVLGDGGPAHQRTVAALVGAGVDRTIVDASGKTALQSSRERGYDEISALLDR